MAITDTIDVEGPGTWSDGQDELRAQRGAALARLDGLATFLDAEWRIPGTKIRFGLDPVISLVPVAGDLAGGLMAAYVIHQAARHGAPRRLILQMMMNVGIDVVFGSVPIAGTVFDVLFKASKRNVRLLRKHLEERDILDLEARMSARRD
jgi:hypothetical protein